MYDDINYYKTRVRVYYYRACLSLNTLFVYIKPRLSTAGRQQEGSQGPVEGRQQVDMVAVEDTVAWDTQPLLGHREEGSLSSLLL